MSAQRLGAELPLITVTLWLQSAGVAMLIAWVRRALEGDMQQIGALRSTALIVRLTAAVVVLHGMEILLWACFYRWRCLLAPASKSEDRRHGSASPVITPTASKLGPHVEIEHPVRDTR